MCVTWCRQLRWGRRCQNACGCPARAGPHAVSCQPRTSMTTMSADACSRSSCRARKVDDGWMQQPWVASGQQRSECNTCQAEQLPAASYPPAASAQCSQTSCAASRRTPAARPQRRGNNCSAGVAAQQRQGGWRGGGRAFELHRTLHQTQGSNTGARLRGKCSEAAGARYSCLLPATSRHSRIGNGSVALLPRGVPNLTLDQIAIAHSQLLGGKLHAWNNIDGSRQQLKITAACAQRRQEAQTSRPAATPAPRAPAQPQLTYGGLGVGLELVAAAVAGGLQKPACQHHRLADQDHLHRLTGTKAPREPRQPIALTRSG